ncbi:BnaCnng73890D [Brassica napus]|uniref:(rape) hypothetical protein n=2 Tax=Brassica napus TaxID=3708 RepID=A0A078JS20_BRANA|nr:unnamed protein product [Brassica napus]CAF2114301.1 unnamed protein product [Brassica napus]CDY68217.1 BnaCnng58080D [Brassica napus]CDY71671.1 BnaCnng73890D [Brassica napus]
MQLWVDMLFVNEKVLQLWPQLLALANTNTHLRGVSVALSVFDGLAYEFHKKLVGFGSAQGLS